MLQEFRLALADMGQVPIPLMIVVCATVSLMVGVGVYVGAGHLVALIQLPDWPWLDWLVQLIARLGGVVLAVLLFPLVMVALTGLFAELVLDPVERRRYPALPPAREQPMMQVVLGSLGFLLRALLLNLLVLIGGLLLPVLNIVLAWLVNSHLLAREFTDLVALRHVEPARLRAWRRRHRLALWGRGLAMALLFVVPVVNLVAPILATLLTAHWLARSDLYPAAELADGPNRRAG